MQRALCHVVRRDSSATKADRVEIAFILVFVCLFVCCCCFFVFVCLFVFVLFLLFAETIDR